MTGSKAGKVTALVIGMTIAGTALAWGGNQDGDGGGRHHGRSGGEFNAGACDMQGGGRMGGGPFGQAMDRELTMDQVQTLAEARLIRMGNDNLKVGKVKATDTGYNVTIVTEKSGDLVQSLELTKNGIPVEMMARRESRQKALK